MKHWANGSKVLGLATLAALPLIGAPTVPFYHMEMPGRAGVDTTELRRTMSLNQNWRFTQNDALTDDAALSSTGAAWQAVSLPHTWNAQDAASLKATTPYKRGLGWYRLEFPTPQEGARHWLEFGAASLVADIWLNGTKLGRHRGGFTAFRFDVTSTLTTSRPNVLLVKTDNREPDDEGDPTAIDPLGGDFNRSGGLYRYVTLISTPTPVHFSLGDLGGPGVYATTTSIAGGRATIELRARLKSEAAQGGPYTVRFTMLDSAGKGAGRAERQVQLAPGGDLEVDHTLNITRPHLWQGRTDPYLYRFVAELLASNGQPVDRVVQRFGIREMRFDPNRGFFLNGRHVRLRGVAMHQDYLGKGWATTHADMEESLKLVSEVGANVVRLGHYPFSQYVLSLADQLGLVVWSEKPSGLQTTVADCTADPTPAFMANARQQLQEMIRQSYNHASVAMWSIGNETEGGQTKCPEPHDNVTPYLRDLHQVAKREDPGRATANAEFSSGGGHLGSVPFSITGITDVLGTNRYYLWYALEADEFAPLLDSMHAKNPSQSLGVTEYGAGAALTHHTDNPLGGPPEVRPAPKGLVSYQPEEYAAYVHEWNYRLLSSKPYLWGTFVWNMFDFGSDFRNEGDLIGVNTKGLVTFDRKTRKDAFYFYKANWTREPVTHIVGRRYTDRAYSVTDVRVYSNADSVRLSLNGKLVGSLRQSQCELRACTFRNVRLSRGGNALAATGSYAGKQVTDSVHWSFKRDDVNIAAGRLTTGYVSAAGVRFGSDHFFSGGTGSYIEIGEDATGLIPPISGTDDPPLYKYLRYGRFSYVIPLTNGAYDVTLGFVEPADSTAVGSRVFDVVANGQTKLQRFDVLKEAGGKYRSVVTRTFPVNVAGGSLTLDFRRVQGQAVVSNMMIRRR